MRDLLDKLTTILSESNNRSDEGYKIIPHSIDRDRYQERDGLEGPFLANTGKVVYYDPKEGKYYDPDSDFYIDDDEAMRLFDRTDEDDLDFQEIIPQANALENFKIGDQFGISFSEDFEIGTTIVDLAEDGIVISLDETALDFLANQGFTFEEGELAEGVAGPKSCWKGYRKVGTKPGTGKNAGKRVNDCEKISEHIDEAEYQGRKVQLNKKMPGDVKKSKVYVKNPKGNVVKVNFGDKNMRIKKSNPERRKSFRARHNCDNPGPKHKARYWSCKSW